MYSNLACFSLAANVAVKERERGGGGVYKTPGDSLTALQAYNLCKDVN